ncbi:MAG: NFACT family protein, partial [Selenomonadaceae bacterium]|nr:NFACT family protein [Selenomonadaceae bacterium]
MSLDGISMHPLAIELDRAVAGGRIDRINQPSKQSIVMSLRLPGKNVLLHITINPQNPAMHLIDKALENPPEPPMFCMVLRKHLETGRIAGVRQYGLDRLLMLDIDFLSAGGKIITKTLVVELMGKYSNIILVQDGIIIDALRKVGTNSSRVRTVLPGDAYVLPPQQDKLNLLETPIREAIAAIRTKGDMKLSKAILDTCLGFGPVTA